MFSAASQAGQAARTAPRNDAGTGRRPAAADAPAGYAWVKGLPDLNRATRRLIGKSGAGWTFTIICSLLHHVGRIGRPHARKAARDDQRLGVGVHAIADESGHDPRKVRRDLAKLAAIGVITVARPNVTVSRDPQTGKITENRTGRSLPTLVWLTIGPEHLRVKAEPAASPAKMDPLSPSKMERLPAPDRDHPGGAIQRDRNTKRTPAGDACGIGTPPAAPEAGLPAGQAPARLAPLAPRPPAHARPQRPPWGHDTGGRSAAEADAQWRRVDPEAERRRREWLAAKAAKAARREAEAATTPPAPPADDAGERLRRSLDELPAESRQRAADVGQAGIDIEDEARRLAEIIERRRREAAEPAGAGAAA
jgi:hypothetical protein